MDKHIDFDEIIEYLDCRELNENSMKLAQKINSHILQCQECRKMYDATLAFYDIAFNDSLDSNLFSRSENVAMLIKFVIQDKKNIILNHVDKMIHRYDYPIAVGARGSAMMQGGDYSQVVDEDNGLNTISIQENACKIEVDKDDYINGAPIIFVKNDLGEVVYAGVMDELDDVYYINVPIESQEYSIFISAEGQ